MVLVANPRMAVNEMRLFCWVGIYTRPTRGGEWVKLTTIG